MSFTNALFSFSINSHAERKEKNISLNNKYLQYLIGEYDWLIVCFYLKKKKQVHNNKKNRLWFFTKEFTKNFKKILTHWARSSFLRKFFQDVIFMGSSLLVIALNDLFIISYRLVIVLFFVLSHNESSFASNWDCLSQFFVLFHVIYNMCEKKEENSKFFSVILILLSFSI